MASPITIGGLQALIAGQGDTFLWGSAFQTLLAQIAATCLQTTGGSFPLTADLNLGTSFGLLAPYYKSANGANVAASGVLRLLNTESVAWRNVGNSADNLLGIGQGAGQPTDELVFKNATAGIVHQITGNPYAEYNTTAGQSIPNATFTTINYGTKVTDTDNAVTTGATWVFTVPPNKGGIYLVSAEAMLLSAPVGTSPFHVAMTINVNGGEITRSSEWNSGTAWVGNTEFAVMGFANVAAGATIAVQIFQGSTTGGAVTLNTSAQFNRIAICRLPVGNS